MARKTWRVLYEGIEQMIDVNWNPGRPPICYVKAGQAPISSVREQREYALVAYGRTFSLQLQHTGVSVSMELICDGDRLSPGELYQIKEKKVDRSREND